MDEETNRSEIIGPQLPPDFQFPQVAPPGETEGRVPTGPSNDVSAETGLPERNGVSVEASVSGAPSGVDLQSKATEEVPDSVSKADSVVAQTRNIALVREIYTSYNTSNILKVACMVSIVVLFKRK